MNTDKENIKVNVLVVGDWFIDEHWVVGPHRSATASRTGSRHERALHHPSKSTVMAFCGAGRSASTLYQAHKENYHIHGLGVWNDRDTELLKMMFNPANLKGLTPFRIEKSLKAIEEDNSESKPVENVTLYNLANVLKEKQDRVEVTTTRIIRIYHSTKAKSTEEYFRLDWEPPPDPILEDQDKLNEIYQNDKEFSRKLDLPGSVRVVIVKDMLRGVVSSPLIKLLVNKYNEALWFVSTKAWLPEWIRELSELGRSDETKRRGLQLLMIPQAAAQAAIRDGKLNRWLTKQGLPTDRAIRVIDDIKKEYLGNHQKDAKIVVIPERNSVLALDSSKSKDVMCYIHPDRSPKQFDLNMASIFLPKLALELLKVDETTNSNGEDDISSRTKFKSALETSLREK